MEFEAENLLKEKRWVEAEAKLKEAIAIRSLFSPAPLYAKLAEAQYQQGKFPDALKSMKIAFSDSSVASASEPLRVVRFAEIAERCREAEAVNPYLKAALKGANSDIQEALKSARTPAQFKALVYVFAGEKARLQSDHERKKELNLKAVRIDPQCALAHAFLAQISGKTPEAMAHLKAASKYGHPSLKRQAEDDMTRLSYYLNVRG